MLDILKQNKLGILFTSYSVRKEDKLFQNIYGHNNIKRLFRITEEDGEEDTATADEDAEEDTEEADLFG
jgi:hypothetical protein